MPEKSMGADLSEQIYQEHRDASWKLDSSKQKKEFLDESDFVSKFIAAISGKRREVEQRVQESRKTYEENLRLAQEHIDEMHEQANEYVKSYEVYERELQRLTQELGAQYSERVEALPWPASTADINGYIDEMVGLKVERGISLEDRARIVAAIDIFKPKMDNPGFAGESFVIGEGTDSVEVGIYNGSRFPRWELGQDNIASASEVAHSKGWKDILEVSTAVTYPRRYDSPKDPSVEAEKKVYIALSDETANLLKQAGPDNLNSSSTLTSKFGRGLDLSTLHNSFNVIELERVRQNN